MPMSGNPQLDYPINTLPDKPKPAFERIGPKKAKTAVLCIG